MSGAIRPEDLTPEERELMKAKFNWDGTTPVPPNFAETVGAKKVRPMVRQGASPSSTAVMDAIKQAMNEPVPDTYDDEDDYPPNVGITNSGKLASSLGNLRDASAQAHAVMAGEKPDDLSEDEKPAEPEDPEKTAERLAEEEMKRQEAVKLKQKAQLRKMVSVDDRQRFAEAIVTQTSYMKSYKLLGDSIEIVLRDSPHDDKDAVTRQTIIDRMIGRDEQDMSYANSTTFQYQMAMSLVSISVLRNGEMAQIVGTQPGVSHMSWMPHVMKSIGNGPEIQLDKRDTAVRWWFMILATDSLKGSLLTLVSECYMRFMAEMNALMTLALEPDFFE
jgi:hypothetical protein